MVGLHNHAHMTTEHFPEPPQIEGMPPGTQRLQILFRQSKQPDRRPQSSPVFRMRRMLKLFLHMNESAGGLDQALEVLGVLSSRRLLEPNLLENIVCFVISLFVPAVKKCPIIGMAGDHIAPRIFVAAFQCPHELGNSLAFAHGGRNLAAPAMMGKRSRFSLREGERLHDRRRSEK